VIGLVQTVCELIRKRSDGGHCDQRYRTGGEDQEGAVQDGQAGRVPGDTACDLANRVIRLIGIGIKRYIAAAEFAATQICTSARVGLSHSTIV